MNEDSRISTVAGLVAALLLIVEHNVLWRFKRHMDGYGRPVAYIIGTGTLLACFWGWALARRDVRAAWALTVIVGMGGAGDIAAYVWRWYWDEQDQRVFGAVPPRWKGAANERVTTLDYTLYRN